AAGPGRRGGAAGAARRRPGRDDRYRRRLEPAAVAEPAVDRPAAARLPAHHPVHRPSGGERQLFTTETQRAQSRQKRNGIVGELKSSLSSLSLCPLCGLCASVVNTLLY